MAYSYGTLSMLDALVNAPTRQTVVDFGEDKIWEQFDRVLKIHNEQFKQSMIPDLCFETEESLLRYGGNAFMEMELSDEFGVPDAQKVLTGSTMGIPLNRFAIGLQWTQDYFELKTPKELAEEFAAGVDADIRRFAFEVKSALFSPGNRLDYIDRFYKQVNLPVRALLNGDGEPIPFGPDGEEFDPSTHNHYSAGNDAGAPLVASPTTAQELSAWEAAFDRVIQNVAEHQPVGEMRLYLNQAQEAIIRKITTKFYALPDDRIDYGAGSQQAFAKGGSVDLFRTNNRKIGVYGPATVYVKPWIPSGYLVALDSGKPGYKPLAIRTREGGRRAELGVRAEFSQWPLRARVMTREYGIGVWNRHMAAIHDALHGTYTKPNMA